MLGGERAQPRGFGQIALGGAGLAQRGVEFGDARELAPVLVSASSRAASLRASSASASPSRARVRGEIGRQLGALRRRRFEIGAEALGHGGALAQRGGKPRLFGAAGPRRRRRGALAVRKPDLEAARARLQRRDRRAILVGEGFQFGRRASARRRASRRRFALERQIAKREFVRAEVRAQLARLALQRARTPRAARTISSACAAETSSRATIRLGLPADLDPPPRGDVLDRAQALLEAHQLDRVLRAQRVAFGDRLRFGQRRLQARPRLREPPRAARNRRRRHQRQQRGDRNPMQEKIACSTKGDAVPASSGRHHRTPPPLKQSGSRRDTERTIRRRRDAAAAQNGFQVARSVNLR